MKNLLLILLLAAIGGWYCYDKYGKTAAPRGDSAEVSDPRARRNPRPRKNALPDEGGRQERLDFAPSCGNACAGIPRGGAVEKGFRLNHGRRPPTLRRGLRKTARIRFKAENRGNRRCEHRGVAQTSARRARRAFRAFQGGVRRRLLRHALGVFGGVFRAFGNRAGSRRRCRRPTRRNSRQKPFRCC